MQATSLKSYLTTSCEDNHWQKTRCFCFWSLNQNSKSNIVTFLSSLISPHLYDQYFIFRADKFCVVEEMEVVLKYVDQDKSLMSGTHSSSLLGFSLDSTLETSFECSLYIDEAEELKRKRCLLSDAVVQISVFKVYRGYHGLNLVSGNRVITCVRLERLLKQLSTVSLLEVKPICGLLQWSPCRFLNQSLTALQNDWWRLTI